MFHKILWQYTCWLPHTDFFFSFSCSIVFNMLGATVLILAHWVHWLSHKSVDIQPVHEKYSMRKYGESSPSRWFDLIILVLFPVCGWQQHNSVLFFKQKILQVYKFLLYCTLRSYGQTQHLWSTGTHNTTKTTVHHWIQETPNNLLFWASWCPALTIWFSHFAYFSASGTLNCSLPACLVQVLDR